MEKRVVLLALAILEITAAVVSRQTQVDLAIVRRQADTLTLWRSSNGTTLMIAQFLRGRSEGGRVTIGERA